MIAAGIDVGASATKVLLRENGSIVGHSLKVRSQGESAAVLSAEALCTALETYGLSNEMVRIVSTGAGGQEVKDAEQHATLVTCLAQGAKHLVPEVKTVVDVGAEKCLAFRLDENGKPRGFSLNDKCAAGTGLLLEMLASILRVELAELGSLAMLSEARIDIDSTCAVFMESEAISLIHRGTKAADVARAVVESIASRIYGVILKAGVEPPLMMCGGMALNCGVVESVKRQAKIDVIIPDNAQFVPALGAAILAERKEGR